MFRVLVALTLAWMGWAGWSMMGRSYPYQLRVLDDLGNPIVAAVVDVEGAQAGTTGDTGLVDLVWNRTARVLEVSAPGHVPRMITLSTRPEGRFDVVLTARVLRGRVVDPEGNGVDGAVIAAGAAEAVSDPDGYFQIRGAEEGVVAVRRPAWVGAEFTWDGESGDTTVELVPFDARAVHINGQAARDRFGEFIAMARETELNAVMIDLKDETGLVWYDTKNATANEVGAAFAAYELEELVTEAHAEGLYVIGRLVAFQDPTAAVLKPEMAVTDSSTNSPYTHNGQYYLDPTDPDARDYALDLAVEACTIGLDEVQFDYVRFPDQRPASVVFDGGVGAEVRMTTINRFLRDAVEMLHPLGCAVAADVFGFTTNAIDDGAIGQKWEDITSIVDVASPMLYPSHYGTGWYGFDDPNDHPAEVVRNAIEDGMARLSRELVIRPWLQDFGYTPEQVRAQIEVVESFGLGWMLWNSQSHVTTEALDPAIPD